MEFVVTGLIPDPEQDQDAYGKTYRQSCDVEERIGFVLEDISAGKFEIGLEHDGAFLAVLPRLSKKSVPNMQNFDCERFAAGRPGGGVRKRYSQCAVSEAARPNIAVIR